VDPRAGLEDVKKRKFLTKKDEGQLLSENYTRKEPFCGPTIGLYKEVEENISLSKKIKHKNFIK
jgi:hypothetical protein